jgi:hypothetical protein
VEGRDKETRKEIKKERKVEIKNIWAVKVYYNQRNLHIS